MTQVLQHTSNYAVVIIPQVAYLLFYFSINIDIFILTPMKTVLDVMFQIMNLAGW